MKRDMDLIREILLKIESCEDPWGLEKHPTIESYSASQIGYHIKLLVDAGLVEGHDVTSLGSLHPEFMSLNLTPEGHDFLSAAQDNSIWQKAKEHILKPGTSFTLDLVTAYLKTKAAEKLGLTL